ncbi:MAG: SIMPL domain-containing protein [Planctomycetota bacterium]|nr:SIMPL domain-containing protein [Planctomycetota bacterium]
MRTMLSLVAASLTLSLLPVPAALAQNDAARVLEGDVIPTLTVTGVSDLKVAPDELRLVLSVVTEGGEGTSPKDLSSENSRKIERIIDAIKDLGVPNEDIETSRFNVYPRYSQPRRGEANRIIGYRVENEIRIETTLIDKAGQIIEAAVDAGANQVSSITFGLRDERAHRAEAIRQATFNARADAQALAAAGGVSLVRTLRIELDQPNINPPQPMFRMSGAEAMTADAASAAPPINPGEVDVNALVTIIYQVADGPGGDPRDRRDAGSGASGR